MFGYCCMQRKKRIALRLTCLSVRVFVCECVCARVLREKLYAVMTVYK